MQHAQALAHTLERGERMPNIIKTYQLGNTTVHIASDHFVTGAELERMHDDLSQATWAIWDQMSDEEQTEFNKESA